MNLAQFAEPDDEYAEARATTGKRERSRLAKSELWMMASMWAGWHADDIAGRPRGPGDRPCRPFEEWGADDPWVALAVRYGLSKADLERLLLQLSAELETRAERAGFFGAWRP